MCQESIVDFESPQIDMWIGREELMGRSEVARIESFESREDDNSRLENEISDTYRKTNCLDRVACEESVTIV